SFSLDARAPRLARRFASAERLAHRAHHGWPRPPVHRRPGPSLSRGRSRSRPTPSAPQTMAQRLVDLLQNPFALAVLDTHSQHGDETVVLDPGSWHEVCRFLRDAPPAQMNMLTDLTAVDFPERDPRFEVVAHLYSLHHGHRLRVKTRVGDETGEGAAVDSL